MNFKKKNAANAPAPNQAQQAARRRSLRSGAYASVLAVVVLVLVILLNLVVGAVPTKFTQFDISTGKMFTLSDTTKTMLQELADNETASRQEEKPKQNDEPEQKASVNDNEEAGGNQSNAGNGGQTTDSPKDNVSNPQPASVAYSPQNVVSKTSNSGAVVVSSLPDSITVSFVPSFFFSIFRLIFFSF